MILAREIPRPEAVTTVNGLLQSPDKLAQMVVGASGRGKSCVLAQVLRELEKRRVCFLAIRLDNLPVVAGTKALGHELGLPDSPGIVLAGLSQGRPGILVIDQVPGIDTTVLRYTQCPPGGSVELWTVNGGDHYLFWNQLAPHLAWSPGTDDNWISYYEVRRNGAPLDKAAKGTFYFDHSAGADLAANYEIFTADGSGNVSTAVRADGYAVTPARIIDDAAPDGLKFTGDWQHQNGLWPAHDHTLSSSRAKAKHHRRLRECLAPKLGSWQNRDLSDVEVRPLRRFGLATPQHRIPLSGQFSLLVMR